MEQHVAPTTQEKRFKLRPKQWEAIVNSNKRMTELREQMTREQERMATESALILEAFDLDPESTARIDEQTRELVIDVPASDVATA